MAEQDVRPQQLSIAKIAHLWSAETGDSAKEIERDLAEWAYAASSDGARIGTESSTDEEAPAKLKIEPDPRRELCLEDLETFCRESDRLLPHIWPDAPDQGDDEPPSQERDISRLVVRAMDRMGASPRSAASRREPRDTGPTKPAPSSVTANQVAAGAGELDSPGRKPGVEPASADKEIRTAEKTPTANRTPESKHKPNGGPLRGAAPRTSDVPVKVMRPAPAFAAAPPARTAPAPLSMIAAGFLGGTLMAAVGGAAWLEFQGPGLEAFLRGEKAPQAELAKTKQRAGDLAARAAKASEENERLLGQLNESRRRNDTLLARIEDIGALGPRLTESQESNAGLRRTLSTLTADLNAAREGGGAAVRAIEEELSSAREALNQAKADTQAARNDTESLTGALAEANTEIENLVLSGTAANAVVQRLENELTASRQDLQALDQDRNKLQTLLAARNEELTDTRARAGQLAAAEKETGRLSAAFDTAGVEIAALTSSLDAERQTLDAERQATAQIRDQVTAAAEKIQGLTNDLARTQAVNTDLRAEAESLNTQAAQLSELLATTREDAKALAAERDTAVAKARNLERDLSGAQGEADTLRASLEGTNSASAQLTLRLAAAERQAAALSADRQSAEARIDTLVQELEAGKIAATKQDTARTEALSHVETLNANLDIAKLEIAALTSSLDAERLTALRIRDQVTAAAEKNQGLTNDLARAQAANTDLRAEAKGLDTKAAQLSELLATTREDTKTLAAERDSAIAKAKDLERGLNGAQDEADTLRASLDGTQGASAQLAIRLAAAERRASTLSADRQEAGTRADTLAKDLETAKQATAKQDAARIAAQKRVESLAVSLAAANAEVLNLRTRTRKAEDKSDRLEETLASLKAEAVAQAAKLTASGKLPQAEPPKESLIGALALPSSGDRKLDVAPKASAVLVASQTEGGEPAARQTAKGNGAANLMITRGEEYLGHGDIASARLFFEQAAEQGAGAALTALGRTYDPRILNELGVLGAFADPETAIRWYERAISAGDEEASQHLKALRAWRKS